MAMTFTIASAARDVLGEVVQKRLQREKEDDDRRAKEYEEVRLCSRVKRVTVALIRHRRKLNGQEERP